MQGGRAFGGTSNDVGVSSDVGTETEVGRLREEVFKMRAVFERTQHGEDEAPPIYSA